MRTLDLITEKLTKAFTPESLDVTDESHQHAGHSGARPGGQTHFRVSIVAHRVPGKDPARAPPHDQCDAFERACRRRACARHPRRGAGGRWGVAPYSAEIF